MAEYKSTEEILALTLAELVCHRPAMWTATGSLEQVLAWLDGADSALLHAGTRPADDSCTAALDWLAETCGYDRERTITPADRCARVRQRFATDEAVFAALSEYLAARSPLRRH